MYCELCGSQAHNTNQWCALEALADRLDRYEFKVNEGPQGFGGGRRGGGIYRGGRTGRRQLVRYFNCDEKGNLKIYFPLPRRP
jgi:hypothetical protein